MRSPRVILLPLGELFFFVVVTALGDIKVFMQIQNQSSNLLLLLKIANQRSFFLFTLSAMK